MGPTDPQTYNISDVWGEFNAPWTLGSGYYGFLDDEVEENAPSAVQMENLIKGRRLECALSAANGIEAQFWKLPSGTDDEKAKQPYGVPYSVVPITSAQVTAIGAGTLTAGFHGANASGYSTCYGVDSSATKYARYRNYVDVLPNGTCDITEAVVDQIVSMLMDLSWKGPITADQFTSGAFDNLHLHAGKNMIVAAGRKARENNNDLGADLGKYAGMTQTRGITWERVEDFDTDTTTPILAIDYSCLRPVVHKGEWQREYQPKRLESKHRFIVTDVDYKYQIVNTNRHRHGRLDYVT
jgi:hypothetical protein